MKRIAAIALFILASFLAHGATLLRLQEGAYDSDAQAYFNTLIANGCVTPSVAFKQAVSAYVVAEKAAGNWGGQDFSYITATADQCTASVNLAQPNLYKITYSGACTFAVASGLNGDGSTCFGDTGVNLSVLPRIQRNSSHIDVCVGIGGTTIGGIASSSFVLISSPINKTTDITGSGIVDSGGGGPGCHYGVRTSSSVASTGKNGIVQSNAVANASVALPAVDDALCRSSGTFCSSGVNIFFAEVGQPLVSDSIHYTNVRTMLLALGATGI